MNKIILRIMGTEYVFISALAIFTYKNR